MLAVELVGLASLRSPGCHDTTASTSLEQAGADHVDLARAAFFGRRAVVAQRAGVSRRGQPLLHGDRRRERAGAEQVVAAAVPGRVLLDRVARRGLRFLRQAGQRVELADDADHRLAGAERRDERRRDVGDARRHLEARRRAAAAAGARCSSAS